MSFSGIGRRCPRPELVQYRRAALIGLIMALWLACLNALSLWSNSRIVMLSRELQRHGMNVCCIQETRFSTRDQESIRFSVFALHSTCFDGRS